MKAQRLSFRALSWCGLLGLAMCGGCGGSSGLGASGTAAASNVGAAAPSYTSAGDGFAVWLPGKPKEASQQVGIPGVGATTVRIISLSTPSAAYMIVPTVVPAGASMSSPKPFLDGVQTGFLSSSGGRLVSSRDIKLGEYPGREIVVSSGASQVKGRILLTGKHSYQVMAIVPPGRPLWGAEISKVLDSFQVLSQ